MLLILPIILSRISHNFHPLFFIYFHAITYYSILFLKFDCVTCKIVYFSTIKIDNIINSSNSSYKMHCCFHIHYQINIWLISLHSPILVPNNFIIMLVSIL